MQLHKPRFMLPIMLLAFAFYSAHPAEAALQNRVEADVVEASTDVAATIPAIVYEGTDGNVYELARIDGQWVATNLTGLTHAPTMSGVNGTPYAYDRGDNVTAVLYEGDDFHTHEIAWINGGWEHTDLTAASGGPSHGSRPIGYRKCDGTPAVVTSTGTGFIEYTLKQTWAYQEVVFDQSVQGAEHVFPLCRSDGQNSYIFQAGSRDRLTEALFVNGTWSFTPLSTKTGDPAEALTFMAYTRGDNVSAIVYVNNRLDQPTDFHINELAFVNGAWQHTDLTVATSAPIPTNTEVWGFARVNTLASVFYNDDNGHIQELYLTAEGWGFVDRTVSQQAPTGGRFPQGFNWGAANSMVVYAASDDHIRAFMIENQQWSNLDLTEAVPAPESLGNYPFGYARMAPKPPPPSYPDLIVQSILISRTGISVVVKNQGTVAVPAGVGFWIDVYIGASNPPAKPNDIWNSFSDEGLVWGVDGDALPLEPGETITLSLNDTYYWPSLSYFGGTISPDTPIYVQVDSANTQTTYGGVLESDELPGTTYNNVIGPSHLKTASTGGALLYLPHLATSAVNNHVVQDTGESKAPDKDSRNLSLPQRDRRVETQP